MNSKRIKCGIYDYLTIHKTEITEFLAFLSQENAIKFKIVQCNELHTRNRYIDLCAKNIGSILDDVILPRAYKGGHLFQFSMTPVLDSEVIIEMHPYGGVVVPGKIPTANTIEFHELSRALLAEPFFIIRRGWLEFYDTDAIIFNGVLKE